MRTRYWITVTTLLVVALNLGSGSVASARVPTEESHCAAQVYAVGSEPDAAVAPACFTTASEVAEYLESMHSSHVARGTAAVTIVGTVYKDANGSGASLTLWGSGSCDGVTFGFPSLASGWDNTISSARGQNGCWVTLYTSVAYGGSRLNCTPYCASIGTWNDNVKSIVFRPTGTFG